MKNRIGESGVTIVELMVSVGVASALALVLLSVSIYFFGSALRSQAEAEMAIDTHFALRALSEDLRLSSNIAATNSLTDANAPVGGWQTDNTSDVLVLQQPAVTDSNQIIYDPFTGNPYDNEFVYYVSNNNLYKRLIRNDAAPGNSVTTSCPEGSVTPSCPSDRHYAKYISGFDFELYDFNGSVTADPLQARSAKVTISVSRKVYGKTVLFEISTLAKLRN